MSCAGAATAALLLLWLIPEGAVAVGEYSSASLATFVDTMLAEYERESPPQPRTRVSVALDVRHATVDDGAGTMLLLADVKMSWNDSRVSWNATAWSGASVLVSAERLWTPDVALVSAGGWHGAGAAVLRASLTSTGAVTSVHRLALSVPIPLALYEWPRDVQRAVFKFASRAHSQDEIDLQISDHALSVVVESGAWEVESVVGSVARWRRGEEDVPVAQYTVTAARRGAARAAAAGSVLAAAALTLLAAAALPYQQRPPLAAAAAFLAAMWLISAMFHLPSAASTPRVVRVMCAVCVTAAAAGGGAALAALLAARTAPPPRPLRALLSSLSAHVHALAPHQDSENGKSGAWQAVAQLFDAVVVALLVLTVLVLCLVQLV